MQSSPGPTAALAPYWKPWQQSRKPAPNPTLDYSPFFTPLMRPGPAYYNLQDAHVPLPYHWPTPQNDYCPPPPKIELPYAAQNYHSKYAGCNGFDEAQQTACNPPESTVSKPRISSNLEKWTLAALSRIFANQQFIKTRPPWLRNPRTGRVCELDFYCDELKLAVEVQGMQHYVYPNSWHKNRTEFEEQVYRDRLKEDLCKQLGVTLVHVPFTVQQKNVEEFIRAELQRLS